MSEIHGHGPKIQSSGETPKSFDRSGLAASEVIEYSFGGRRLEETGKKWGVLEDAYQASMKKRSAGEIGRGARAPSQENIRGGTTAKVEMKSRQVFAKAYTWTQDRGGMPPHRKTGHVRRPNS